MLSIEIWTIHSKHSLPTFSRGKASINTFCLIISCQNVYSWQYCTLQTYCVAIVIKNVHVTSTKHPAHVEQILHCKTNSILLAWCSITFIIRAVMLRFTGNLSLFSRLPSLLSTHWLWKLPLWDFIMAVLPATKWKHSKI